MRRCTPPLPGAVADGEARSRPKPSTVVPGSSLRGELRPGDRLVVRFEDDMEYGHERMVLWLMFGDADGASEYVILSPNGDLYSEACADWKEAIVMTGLERYPAAGLPPNLAQFTDPLDKTAVRNQVKKGRLEAARLRKAEPDCPVAKAPESAFDWQGKSLNIPVVAWRDEVRSQGRLPLHRFTRKAGPHLCRRPTTL